MHDLKAEEFESDSTKSSTNHLARHLIQTGISLGAVAVLCSISQVLRADDCESMDSSKAVICESPALSRDSAQDSYTTGPINNKSEVPAAGVLAMDFGIESYRFEVPNADESARIIAYGDRKEDIATVTFAKRASEMEILVETPTSEWKSVTGVRDGIGYTTRFQNISHYNQLTDEHDAFRVESRYKGAAPNVGNKLMQIGFQFNDTELIFDMDEENGAPAFPVEKYDPALQKMLLKHAGPAYIAQEMQIALAVLSDQAVAPHLPKALSPLASTISAMTPSDIRNFTALKSPLKSPKTSDFSVNGLFDDTVDTVGDYFICGGACVGAAGGGASCTTILTCAAWMAAVGTCMNCFDEGGVFESFGSDPVFVPLPGGGSGGCTDVGNLPNATICGDVVICNYDEDTDIITCW